MTWPNLNKNFFCPLLLSNALAHQYISISNHNKMYAFKAFPQLEPETEERDWSALSLVRTMDDVYSRPLNRSPSCIIPLAVNRKREGF